MGGSFRVRTELVFASDLKTLKTVCRRERDSSVTTDGGEVLVAQAVVASTVVQKGCDGST